ncbi:MAG TPA: ABC transporter permease [Candidatus Sulfotelmatobacter sp.]|nr:ABC transporter permease [Candidatus Sulfotelmatobacter sp.]
MAERAIRVDKSWSWRAFFFQWEWLLVLIFIVINIVNSTLSPYYFTADTFLSTPQTFLDMAFLVLPMTMVIVLGMIDISVASTAALSAVIMAVSFHAGLPMPLAALLCLAVATVCGLLNGILITRFKELSSVIVTLATMIIYRGIAYVILTDQASGDFPTWYSSLGWGAVGGVPIILVVFAVCAVVFGLLLHATTFGRRIYAIGNNLTASRYSGVRTDAVIVTVFVLTGLMAGFTSLFLTSRMGSTRPNVAQGYELSVIAMVVLGGVSTSGGKGRIGGPLLAIFIIGFLNYGLGLVNIQAQSLLIIVGLLLILSVLVLNVRFRSRHQRSAPAAAATAAEKRPDDGTNP